MIENSNANTYLQLFTADEAESFLPMQRGDLIKLIGDCNGYTIMTSAWGYGEKNGIRGDFPSECVYVLPTITKPSLGIVVSLYMIIKLIMFI